MRKILFTFFATMIVTACGNTDEGIRLDEQNAMNLAYDLSGELCNKITNAANYEEFKAAREELKAYSEAFRTQIGGEEYLIFIEECNMLLGNKQ